MSKRTRQKRERFVGLEYWMLRSEAWKSLPSDAKAILIHIAMRYNGSNNGYISYAVREADEIGISKDRAARAIAALRERGFLVITRDCGFTLKAAPEAREWRLTYLPSGPHQNIAATKNFLYWSPTSNSKYGRASETERSRQCDRRSKNETIGPLTVAPVRPKSGLEASSRSHQCDTSNLPGSYAPNGEGEGLAVGEASAS